MNNINNINISKNSFYYKERTLFGKNASRRIRKENFIPAILYSKNKKTLHLLIEKSNFNKKKIFKNMDARLIHQDNSTLIQYKSTIIKDIQIDSLTRLPIHVDFLEVDEKNTITIKIPITLKSMVKFRLKGQVKHLIKKTLINCLPFNIPKELEFKLFDDQKNKITLEDIELPTTNQSKYINNINETVFIIKSQS